MDVYIYRGNKGEEVPETVQKLIVNEGVQVLPFELCNDCFSLQEVTLPDGLMKIGSYAFLYCDSLVEINVCNTVQHIGHGAFQDCAGLKNVEFESSPSSPHPLQTIGESAFHSCLSLLRISLPSSVNTIGGYAFSASDSLIEANLSTTAVVEIPESTFYNCSSLQTVSLPNTLRKIGEEAFNNCTELVTVVVPLDSQSINIEFWAFHSCSRLANLVLPKDSTALEAPFVGCTLLYQRYGEDTSRIVAGLIGRFDELLPAHRVCYDHAATTVQDLRQRITAKYKEDSFVDKFGMTPFHVFFSTIEPRIELLEVLLDLLPNQILKYKDANGRRPLNYLIRNWTDGTKSLCQRTLEKSMIDPLSRWGAKSWMESMQSKVQEIVVEEDRRHRGTLCGEVYSALEHYENVQATSILEMALWKGILKSGWTSDGSKRQALDREESRCLSGSGVVIPHVCMFFITPITYSEEESSSEDDSSLEEDPFGSDY